MKVLVTGACGQLGYDICRELDRHKIGYLGVSSRDMDILDKTAVYYYLEKYKPEVVIHCAAYTKVDQAEKEPEQAFAVNKIGTRYIAEICAKIGAKLIYISTDYVFPGIGEQFYETWDKTAPLNIYGHSKLAGEWEVQKILEKYFIVRISWLFGINGDNFVKKMLQLAKSGQQIGVVCDQIGSPTYTRDLAILLYYMMQTDRYGIYHATNEGICSWAEFAEEIFRISGENIQINSISSSQYKALAKRPHNSRMSKKSLDEADLPRLPQWKDAVQRYLNELETSSK